MKVVGIAIISAYLCALTGTQAKSYDCDSWIKGDLYSIFTREFADEWHGPQIFRRDEHPEFEYKLDDTILSVAKAPDGRMVMTNQGPASLRVVLQDPEVGAKWFVAIITPGDQYFVNEEIVAVWIARYLGATIFK